MLQNLYTGRYPQFKARVIDQIVFHHTARRILYIKTVFQYTMRFNPWVMGGNSPNVKGYFASLTDRDRKKRCRGNQPL